MFPGEYIPVVLLLRACGWRISDILNLKFDKCLDRTGQGWYLCGDIVKTQVLNHRVPITDQLALVVQAVVEEVKQKSTFDNNPNKLLFVRFSGRRKGHCLKGDSIRDALNRLARQQNIVDDQGAVFHFGNHAFRHYGECWGMGSKLLSSCVLAVLVGKYQSPTEREPRGEHNSDWPGGIVPSIARAIPVPVDPDLVC